RGEAGILNEFRVVADLLADDFDTRRFSDVREARQVFIGLRRQDRDDVLLAAGARAALDDVENARILLLDLPDFIKDEQRRRARAVFAELADHAQHAGRRAIGERFTHAFRKVFQAVEFVNVERGIAREIWVGRGVEKAVTAELAERELERLRALSSRALERPCGETVNQV